MGDIVPAAKIIEVNMSVCYGQWRKKVRGALRVPKAVKMQLVNRDGDGHFLKPKPTTCPCHRLQPEMLPLDSLVHDAMRGEAERVTESWGLAWL